MHYLLKLFPEITIKSRSVRRHMTRCLAGNVRIILRRLDEGISVKDTWDALHVTLPEALPETLTREMEERLTRIPGIHEVLAIREVPFSDLTDIADRVVPLWQRAIAGRRFRVSAKRRGDHDFSSEHIERLVGRRLLEASPDARVDLTRPEVYVAVEVVHQRLRLIQARWPGLGGYPLGLQGQALTLISGGFDSPVAAWRMMRRGIKTHFLFFNLGGPAHEAGVREVTPVAALRQLVSTSSRYPLRVWSPRSCAACPIMGVVLKRMMVRAAGRIAQRERIPALVTGDAIAQVSSQTLTNLALIDEASELPILRPLLTEDKQDIIAQARRLDTARFAETMPEYCGVISRRPHTSARARDVEQAEAGFDFAVLEAAIGATETTRSDRLMEHRHTPGEVPTVDSPQALAQFGDASVIDIRAPAEREASPLRLPDVPRLEIPFYELQDRAPGLPDDRCYLLYCDQGVMSRMQALHLHDKGLTHFGVYRAT